MLAPYDGSIFMTTAVGACFRESAMSEARFPRTNIIGNSVSENAPSRKPSFRGYPRSAEYRASSIGPGISGFPRTPYSGKLLVNSCIAPVRYVWHSPYIWGSQEWVMAQSGFPRIPYTGSWVSGTTPSRQLVNRGNLPLIDISFLNSNYREVAKFFALFLSDGLPETRLGGTLKTDVRFHECRDPGRAGERGHR